MAFAVLDDYPAAARFLTPDEKAMVLHRLEEDRSALDEGWNSKYAWDAVGDWKASQIRPCDLALLNATFGRSGSRC